MLEQKKVNVAVIPSDSKWFGITYADDKEKAMKVLRARLYDEVQKKQHDEMAKDRKQQVGSGDRSGRIRTYNFPQERMTDHRIGLTLHNLSKILEGDLDGTIDQLNLYFQTEALKKNISGLEDEKPATAWSGHD